MMKLSDLLTGGAPPSGTADNPSGTVLDWRTDVGMGHQLLAHKQG
jgi:hypothetical protein